MIPSRVEQIAGDDYVESVWRNELGGLTYRLVSRNGAAIRYVKWQSYAGLSGNQRKDVDLAVEAEKLRWAGRYGRSIKVPRVLDLGLDDDSAWLVTQGIAGIPAFDPRWKSTPETAVVAIAKGLRHLHDSLPVEECPYRGTWVEEGVSVPAPDKLVVCHGDPCVPNTLLDSAGDFVAQVDFSQMGVADRWADLAIATYSISWDINFGRSYDDVFFEAYGVAPDPERIEFYRSLWDGPKD
jgi:kanamycin kinase